MADATLLLRIASVVDYYNAHRPHTSLGLRTPAEVYAGCPPLHPKLAPRGLLGQVTPPIPLEIRYALDKEQRLPYLVRVA